VTATLGSRTSLKVSTELLQFEISTPDQQAVAVVDFSAGARTHSGAVVMLTVEPLRAITGPGGASDVETALTFGAQGDGLLSEVLQPSTPIVAGRWNGSGLRTGRVMFKLRASATGHYTVPVRFVLSAPQCACSRITQSFSPRARSSLVTAAAAAVTGPIVSDAHAVGSIRIVGGRLEDVRGIPAG
jgi:hypothetical protein